MEVLADEIPPDLMLLSTADKIDYAIARIGEAGLVHGLSVARTVSSGISASTNGRRTCRAVCSTG